MTGHETRPSSAARNASYLFGAQVLTLAAPLALLPYLTRVLGPNMWGQVATAQAGGIVFGTFIEFGFAYSATRIVAINRRDPTALGATLSAVTRAKLLLTVLVSSGTAVGFAAQVLSLNDLVLVCSAIVFGTSQGFSFLWFFQGVEDVQSAVITEVLAKICALILIVLVIHDPHDGWMFLAIQGLLGTVGNCVNYGRSRRYCGRRAASASDVWSMLRRSADTFLLKLLTSTYTVAATMFVHGLSSTYQASYYANADKISSASKSLIQPVSQALFPIAVRKSAHRDEQLRFIVRTLWLICLPAAILALVATLCAPALIPWYFGDRYQSGVPTFQVLIWTLPIVAATNVLGIHGPVARGQVGRLNAMIGATAALTLVLTGALVPRFGATGMAWAVLTSESFLVVLLVSEDARSRRKLRVPAGARSAPSTPDRIRGIL